MAVSPALIHHLIWLFLGGLTGRFGSQGNLYGTFYILSILQGLYG